MITFWSFIPDIKKASRSVIASETAFYRCFGSWKNALKECGFEVDYKGGEWVDNSSLKTEVQHLITVNSSERLTIKEQKKLLTVNKEKELALEVKTGNEVARQHFSMANLRLVYSIAYKSTSKLSRESSLTLNDLIQEGCIGLMNEYVRLK